jgi:hypothetical protein
MHAYVHSAVLQPEVETSRHGPVVHDWGHGGTLISEPFFVTLMPSPPSNTRHHLLLRPNHAGSSDVVFGAPFCGTGKGLDLLADAMLASARAGRTAHQARPKVRQTVEDEVGVGHGGRGSGAIEVCGGVGGVSDLRALSCVGRPNHRLCRPPNFRDLPPCLHLHRPLFRALNAIRDAK